MSIVDIKAMKNDKALFDNMADRLIKDTLNKKKYYASLFNKANMLKNEINKILKDLEDLCINNHIALGKNIYDYIYSELEELIVDLNLDNQIKEKYKILLYKIKMRLDEIKDLRTKMIQLDLYEGHLSGMEDDTLDEEYIDMDRIRFERGIYLDENVTTEITGNSRLIDVNDDYYEYELDGNVNLKQVSQEIYGNPSYWVHIYNYADNNKKINKVVVDNHITIKEILDKPELLEGITIKIPKEIEFYSNEFNTAVLETVS